MIIEDDLKLNEYSLQFPKVTKLTLSTNNFTNLPLTQITDLNIKDYQISFNQLSFFPNLQSLTLSSLPLIQKKLFRKNLITKLIIENDLCELQHIHFLLNHFPHLQFLEIGIHENQYKEILQLIFSKSTHLFSLFLLNINSELTEKIKILFNHYTIERIQGGVYIWW